MSKAELVSIIRAIIGDLQAESGLDRPRLGEDSSPFDLEDFDSVKCVELEVRLSDRLEVEVRDVVLTEFDNKRSPSISLIAERVLGTALEVQQETLDVDA